MSPLSGHWDAKVKEKLEAWLNFHFRKKGGGKSPLAVFDFDNTLIQNDVGEACYYHLVSEMAFSFSPSFFERIGERYKEVEIVKAFKELQKIPPEKRKEAPPYALYKKEMIRAYYDRIRQEGIEVAYPWVVTLFEGMREEELFALNRKAVLKELNNPIGMELLRRDPLDKDPFRMRRGLAPFQEMTGLLQSLKEAGFETAVVSASSHWSLKAIIEELKLPIDRFFGMSVEVKGDILTDELILPHTVGAGKALAIQKYLGRKPNLVVGDGPNDYPMLHTAVDLALLIDHGKNNYGDYALKQGWLVQPRFPAAMNGGLNGFN